jgi:hypothetical protein
MSRITNEFRWIRTALTPCCDGNSLYFDKLIRITENRYTNQRAGGVVVAEAGGDFVPRGDQMVAAAAGNIDGCLQYIMQPSATLLQRNPQVIQRLARLRRDVTLRCHSPLIIERARTRSNDQARLGSGRGVGVWHAREQPVAAHKFCCHANECAIVTAYRLRR